jgi:hypothetical protein
MQDILPYIIAKKRLNGSEAKKFLLLGQGVPTGLNLYAINDLVKSSDDKDKRIAQLEQGSKQVEKARQMFEATLASSDLSDEIKTIVTDFLQTGDLIKLVNLISSDFSRHKEQEIADIQSDLHTYQAAFKMAMRSMTHDFWNDEALDAHAKWVAGLGKPAQRSLTEISFEGPISSEMNKGPLKYAKHREQNSPEYVEAQCKLIQIAKNYQNEVQKVFRTLSEEPQADKSLPG